MIMQLIFDVLVRDFDLMIDYSLKAREKIQREWLRHSENKFGSDSDRLTKEMDKIVSMLKQIENPKFERIVLPLFPNLEPSTSKKK